MCTQAVSDDGPWPVSVPVASQTCQSQRYTSHADSMCGQAANGSLTVPGKSLCDTACRASLSEADA